MNDFTEQLECLGACEDSIEWVNGRSLRKCWQVCDRADWMLWLADELGIDRKLLVMAACDCAETAQKYADDGGVSANTIKVARDWCEFKATTAKVLKAARAADYAAADAEGAAADSADSAYHAALATDDDTDYAAYYAVQAAADAASASGVALKKMAKLVRKRIPVEVIEKALQWNYRYKN